MNAGAAASERHSNRPIRDGMAPPPTAGGDAIVSTHTIPEEEQAQRHCCTTGGHVVIRNPTWLLPSTLVGWVHLFCCYDSNSGWLVVVLRWLDGLICFVAIISCWPAVVFFVIFFMPSCFPLLDSNCFFHLFSFLLSFYCFPIFLFCCK